MVEDKKMDERADERADILKDYFNVYSSSGKGLHIQGWYSLLEWFDKF